MATKTSTTSDRQYKVIGTSPVRHDGADKVTGRAEYGADIHMSGLLHGKVLRSPHSHARIKSLDTSRAEAHPDVKGVATSRDLDPAGPMGAGVGLGQTPSDNVLARGKVLYKGHAIAAVAASSPHVAEEALGLIDVEYEPLPAVSNVEDAMKDGAPVLHEDMRQVRPLEDGAADGLNVAVHEVHEHGDLDKGFQQADLVLEREYRTKSVHQGYIEPQNATVYWGPDGHITVWCSSQGHFAVRDQTSKVLGVPVSSIKVVPMEIGGGFGGKLPVYLEPVAAVLSKKSGHPVKMTMNRDEVFEGTGPTSGSHVRVKIGVTRDGKITAAHADFAFEAGAFPGGPLPGGVAAIFAPYDIENVRVDALDVVSNKPKTAAYRAPGAPIVAYAAETLMDELAEKLEMDPIEFRLRNAAHEGTRRADGLINGRIGAIEVMEAVSSHPHYSAPKDGRQRGRGVAMGFCRNNTGPSAVTASVLGDGTVSLVEGSVDIGGTRTAVAQQFAEVLDLSAEDIMPAVGDTESIGYTSVTGGSAVAFKTGWAAIQAAEDVKEQMRERAAKVWDVPLESVEYANAALSHVSDPELKMSFVEMAGMLNDTGGPIIGRSDVVPTGSSGSYSANIVDIEVDPETGKVDILRYTAFQDAGFAIHPGYVEGQIQGGTAQGVGWALNEEYFVDDQGHMVNSSLLDYRMPTALDLPFIEAVIVEVPNPGHPYGVRGVGEANISPPIAAIANAIHDAVGLRMRSLPMSPPAIVKALQEASA